MPRPVPSTEERVLRALREARAITGPELDDSLAALTATETCTKCNGTGNSAPAEQAPACDRCSSTGQQYVIR